MARKTKKKKQRTAIEAGLDELARLAQGQGEEGLTAVELAERASLNAQTVRARLRVGINAGRIEHGRAPRVNIAGRTIMVNVYRFIKAKATRARG